MKKLTIILGSFVSVYSFAYDGSIDISHCPTTVITVDNVDTASGWGAHFSTYSLSDGYGGSKAECHLTGANSGSGAGSVVALCYDGYINATSHVDQYRLDLGPRNLIRGVEFKITNRGVEVEALAHSTSGNTTDENDYFKRAFFPFREASGFCRENRLYYQADGNLAGRADRAGSGYSLSVGTLD